MNISVYRILPCLAAGILLVFTNVQAQNDTDTTYWKNSVSAGINFNQASFSENWTGGGVGSVSLGSYLNASADYKKDKVTWNNQFELLYGVVSNEGQSTRKIQDKIFYDSKLGTRINEQFNSYLSLNFLSQFAGGFRFREDSLGEEQPLRISDAFAPAFITASLGFEYKPVDYFSLRAGPLSPRLTIVTDTTLINNVPENYGVKRGETTRFELFAFQLLANFNKNLTDNIKLQARYQFFADYQQFQADLFDHRLGLTVTAGIASFIDVNFTSIIIYDSDQDDEIQFSQNLGVGIALNFKNYEEEE
jgi:hypothetical protein